MRRRVVVHSGILLAVALLLAPASALAQHVRGLILDAATYQPLPGATVSLHDPAGTEIARGIADSVGLFALRAPSAGAYALSVRRIGYQAGAPTTVRLAAGETRALTIQLSPAASHLPPITVRERRWREWGIDGFHDRRALGRGVFLTPAHYEKMDPLYFSDIFRDIDGIVVSHPYVYSQRGWGCLKWGLNRLPLRDIPPFDEITGIEVYREFREVPEEFRMLAWENRYPCGLVMVWTRSAWAPSPRSAPP